MQDTPVCNIDHPLCVRIAKVTLVWQAKVDLGLVERVGDLIREDTGGQARDSFFDAGGVGGVKDIIIDKGIVTVEGELLPPRRR